MEQTTELLATTPSTSHPRQTSRRPNQTLADADQTLADIDQTGSDSDQAAADSDQAAADHNQAAGDTLLKEVVNVIRTHLRSYDTIVRVGCDEFLCVMSGAAIGNVRRRFDSIEAALAADPGNGTIRAGIAGLSPDDSAAELIDRADASMRSHSG